MDALQTSHLVIFLSPLLASQVQCPSHMLLVSFVLSPVTRVFGRRASQAQTGDQNQEQQVRTYSVTDSGGRSCGAFFVPVVSATHRRRRHAPFCEEGCRQFPSLVLAVCYSCPASCPAGHSPVVSVRAGWLWPGAGPGGRGPFLALHPAPPPASLDLVRAQRPVGRHRLWP